MRLVCPLYGIRIWAEVSFVLSELTRLTDRRIYDRHYRVEHNAVR